LEFWCNGKFTKLKTALLLLIVVSISLAGAFRLVGILPAPVEVSETVIAEAISWNTSRPSSYRSFNEVIENLHVDAVVSINFSLFVRSYAENEPG
jgi:hypothetical protein